MNHVPNDVIDKIDSFGRNILTGTPSQIEGQLRRDLRLTIVPDKTVETAELRYLTEHTQAPPILRGRGSFITTIVDNVDSRLQSWGITPPDVYEYVQTRDSVHVYSGQLSLP